jgi:hypothetical protein
MPQQNYIGAGQAKDRRVSPMADPDAANRRSMNTPLPSWSIATTVLQRVP